MSLYPTIQPSITSDVSPVSDKTVYNINVVVPNSVTDTVKFVLN